MTNIKIAERQEPAVDRFARTDTQTRAVHLVECPHLVDRHWHDATDEERDTLPVCQWSRDQLEGHGRSHPATLDDAMRQQGTPSVVVPLIKKILRFVTFDEIWLPYSRSYVALGLGGRAVATFGKGYVEIGERRINLPGYVAARHQGRASQPTYGEDCPKCFVAMPLVGVCDACH